MSDINRRKKVFDKNNFIIIVSIHKIALISHAEQSFIYACKIAMARDHTSIYT